MGCNWLNETTDQGREFLVFGADKGGKQCQQTLKCLSLDQWRTNESENGRKNFLLNNIDAAGVGMKDGDDRGQSQRQEVQVFICDQGLQLVKQVVVCRNWQHFSKAIVNGAKVKVLGTVMLCDPVSDECTWNHHMKGCLPTNGDVQKVKTGNLERSVALSQERRNLRHGLQNGRLDVRIGANGTFDNLR